MVLLFAGLTALLCVGWLFAKNRTFASAPARAMMFFAPCLIGPSTFALAGYVAYRLGLSANPTALAGVWLVGSCFGCAMAPMIAFSTLIVMSAGPDAGTDPEYDLARRLCLLGLVEFVLLVVILFYESPEFLITV